MENYEIFDIILNIKKNVKRNETAKAHTTTSIQVSPPVTTNKTVKGSE